MWYLFPKGSLNSFWCAEDVDWQQEMGCTALHKGVNPRECRLKPVFVCATGYPAEVFQSPRVLLNHFSKLFVSLLFLSLPLQVDEEASMWSSGSSPPTP